MHFHRDSVMKRTIYKCGTHWLVLANFAGFAFGIYTASISVFPFISMMCGLNWNTVSIVRMLCAVLLPYLIIAIAVLLSKPGILYGLLFIRAFMRCFCLYGLIVTFGHAGWLVSILNLTLPSFVDWSVTVFAFQCISREWFCYS